MTALEDDLRRSLRPGCDERNSLVFQQRFQEASIGGKLATDAIVSLLAVCGVRGPSSAVESVVNPVIERKKAELESRKRSEADAEASRILTEGGDKKAKKPEASKLASKKDVAPVEPVEPELYIDFSEFYGLLQSLFLSPNVNSRILRLACANGFLSLLNDMMERGCLPTGVDGRGRNALHCAAEFNKPSALSAILQFDSSVDVNARDNVGWTALMVASANGNLEAVKTLLGAGADVNCQGDRGYTALHWACIKGFSSIVNLLLQASADVNARSTTPLIASVFHDQLECVRLLLSQGADPSLFDVYGNDALHYCNSPRLRSLLSKALAALPPPPNHTTPEEETKETE